MRKTNKCKPKNNKTKRKRSYQKKKGGARSCGSNMNIVRNSITNLLNSAPELLNPELFQEKMLPFRNLIFRSLTGNVITLMDIYGPHTILTLKQAEEMNNVGNIVRHIKDYIVTLSDPYNMNDAVHNWDRKYAEDPNDPSTGRDNWEIRIISSSGTSMSVDESLIDYPENAVFFYVISEIPERINMRRMLEQQRIEQENQDPNRLRRIAEDRQIQMVRGRAQRARQAPRRRRRR